VVTLTDYDHTDQDSIPAIVILEIASSQNYYHEPKSAHYNRISELSKDSNTTMPILKCFILAHLLSPTNSQLALAQTQLMLLLIIN